MAFENINWGMPVQSALRQQEMLQRSIGQGIAAYNAGKDRELREKQIEQQRQERERKAQQLDLKGMAEQAIYKARLGLPVSDQERAAMGAWSDIKGAPVYTDMFGNVIRQPSLEQRVGGLFRSGGLVADAPEDTTFQDLPFGVTPYTTEGTKPVYDTPTNNVGMYDTAPEDMRNGDIYGDMVSPDGKSRDDLRTARADYTSVTPKISMQDLMGNAQPMDNIPTPQPPQGAVDLSVKPMATEAEYDAYRAGGLLKDTKKGALMEEESRKALLEYAAKKNIDLATMPEEKVIELNYQRMLDEQKSASKAKEKARPLFEPMEGYSPSEADVKSMTDITASKITLDRLINEYQKRIRESGAAVKGTATAQKLDNLAGMIRMQVKNLEQLGALQEPDIKAMNEMLGSATMGLGEALVNPVEAYTMLKRGRGLSIGKMEDFQNYIDGVLQTQADVRGFKLKGKASAQPKTKQTESRVIDYREFFK